MIISFSASVTGINTLLSNKGEKQIGIDSKFNYEEAEKVVRMYAMLLVKYALFRRYLVVFPHA